VRHHWSRYATIGSLVRMRNQPTPLPHPTQLTEPIDHFTMRFSSTPRGARLARRLAATRLDAWGFPYGTAAHDDVTLIVAELCGNAVRHGQVPGRDFRLTMTTAARERATAHTSALRIEVTDTRADRLPAPAVHTPLAEAGRGLVIVAALAARWGWNPRLDGPGKTVWAECDVP
jgi:anti-sigma regulatory factor (Ser/Thr protein kinase)